MDSNSSDTIICPKCQSACRIGELVCPHCNTTLTSSGKVSSTIVLKVDDIKAAVEASGKSVGMVFIEAQKQITFEFPKNNLVLPLAESLIVGRSDDEQHAQPDISLNDFDAANCGVSRQHIKITRQRDMIFVTDLGSRNGTFLNQRRIQPNANNVLRSGDQLRLGNLKFRVRF